MAQQFDCLNDKHIEFIQQQNMYFIGTAGQQGYINLSPKGLDSLKIIDSSTVIWLNLTGSGNESAAHVLEDGRMTIMFCSFDKQPLILRLYGAAQVVHPRDSNWSALYQQFDDFLGARQIFSLDIQLVQTSCGFGVPQYEHGTERNTMHTWAEKKGEDGIKHYWKERNAISMNGRTTGILP